jgi:hypothetical protein
MDKIACSFLNAKSQSRILIFHIASLQLCACLRWAGANSFSRQSCQMDIFNLRNQRYLRARITKFSGNFIDYFLPQIALISLISKWKI